MSDIATLGLAVDSRAAVTAASNLDKLAASGKTAQAAASALTKATHDTAESHKGLSGQAQAAAHSVRSMVESLALGTPVTQVLTQQMSHLSYAATGPGGISGAFKQAGGALLGLLSPTTLIVGGLAAVGIAGAAAVHSIAEVEKQFDDTSRAIGTTVALLHGLDSAAAFKGIGTDELLKGMQKFGASVYDAKNNMGGLAEVFRANNTTASTFDDYLYKAADLIKNASTDQQRLQLLQQMGLPATMQWVALLSQGKDGLRAAIDEATKFGNAADEQLIAKARAFDEAWAKVTKNFSTGLRNAVVEGAAWLDSLSQKGTALLMKLNSSVPTNILRNAMNDNAAGYDVGSKLTAGSSVDGFYKGTALSSAAAKTTIDPAVRQRQIALESPLLSLLGQTPAAKPVEQKEKQDDSDRRRLAA